MNPQEKTEKSSAPAINESPPSSLAETRPAANDSSQESQPLSSPEADTTGVKLQQPVAATTSAPADDSVASTTGAATSSSQQDDKSSTLVTPQIADDADLIEKEWVEKAKEIVNKSKDDPHAQTSEMSKFKAVYIKKRFNKEVPLSKE